MQDKVSDRKKAGAQVLDFVLTTHTSIGSCLFLATRRHFDSSRSVYFSNYSTYPILRFCRRKTSLDCVVGHYNVIYPTSPLHELEERESKREKVSE